jgi:tetratricopeptide (TPR) repeat protein
MKKFLAISLLAATALTGACTALVAQDAGQTAPSGQPQQVVIKDQAEYQAYTSAIGQTNPAQKAQALEAFLQQYPNTVVKKEALETLLATYQATQNAPKLLETAQRILQVDPENVQSLLVVAYIKSTQAQQAAAKGPVTPEVIQQYAEAADAAQKALDHLDKLPKPPNVDDAAFQQQKNQIASVMYATIGFASYIKGDYAAAINPLFKAVQLNPQDYADMEYLGISMAKPVTRAQMYTNPEAKTQLLSGVFWLCKAVSIAPPQAKANFTQVAQYYYNRYHGSTEGFDQAVQQAATMKEPGPDFKVTPVPSPQEQAAQVLATTPPENILSQLGFDTWASILTVAQPADQEKVWNATKGKPLDLSGLVVAATNNQIQLAVSDSAQAEKRADVTVNLKTPLRTPPAVGTPDYEVVGIADSYTTQPTFMLTLTNGAPKTKAAPAKPAPTHRTPRRSPR